MNANFFSPPASPQTALDDLLNHVQPDLDKVNFLIDQQVQSAVPTLSAVMSHMLRARGKQVRVLLTLACAKLCGYQGEHHLKLAAAMDLIQTATLLHDDVIDESPLRRGNPSAHTLFGNAASVLVGDFLLTRAFDWVIQVEQWPIMRLLNTMTSQLAQGEIMEIDFHQRLDVSKDAYLEMIGAKTACFFGAACKMPAILAQQPKAVQEALYQFGFALGMAFQLVDDVLDYTADPKALGKKVGEDFLEGKPTLPLLLVHKDASNADQAWLESLFQKPERNEADLASVQQYLHHHKGPEETAHLAKNYVEQAIKALQDTFAKTHLRDVLEATAHFTVKRTF